jgi:hypothetical protein
MADIQQAEVETAQLRFNRTYITSTEIMQNLQISRMALGYARKTGKLPGAIEVNDGMLFIWERAPIEPYLNAWKIVLDARRSV